MCPPPTRGRAEGGGDFSGHVTPGGALRIAYPGLFSSTPSESSVCRATRGTLPTGGDRVRFCHRAFARRAINWVAMRKRKIIAISAVALLGAGLVGFLLTRDAGPPVVVYGNLSAKDVAEIKSAVRRELWREAFPNFSWATVKELPRSVRRALKAHVIRITAWPQNATPGASVRIADPYGPERLGFGRSRVLGVTNGPNGWGYSGPIIFME